MNNLQKSQFAEGSLCSRPFPAFCHLLSQGPYERGAGIWPSHREGRAGLSSPPPDPNFPLNPEPSPPAGHSGARRGLSPEKTAKCGPWFSCWFLPCSAPPRSSCRAGGGQGGRTADLVWMGCRCRGRKTEIQAHGGGTGQDRCSSETTQILD